MNDDKHGWRPNILHDAPYKMTGVDPIWRTVAIVGWVLVMVLAAVAARGENLQRRTGYEFKERASERRAGTGPVPVWLRQGVDTEGAALRRDPVRLPAAGVGVAAEAARAVDGVSASRSLRGDVVGEQGLITKEFLDALECIESGRDAGAVGDQGRSRGSFQFKAVAWSQVNSLRAARGLAGVDYLRGCTSRVTARMYAGEYLRWLESNLAAALRRSPSRPELYAAWNLGLTGFRARGFLLARCPERARDAAERLQNVMEQKAAKEAIR